MNVRIDVCPPRLARNVSTASFTLPADPLLRPLRPIVPNISVLPVPRTARVLSTASSASSGSSSAPKVRLLDAHMTPHLLHTQSPPRREGATDNSLDAISADLSRMLDSVRTLAARPLPLTASF